MQNKTKFTKKQFNAYKQYLEDFPKADTTAFDSEFRNAYNEYSASSEKKKPTIETRPNYEEVQSLLDNMGLGEDYLYKTQEVNTSQGLTNDRRLGKLDKLYERDYKAFQSDSAEFKNIDLDLDLLNLEFDEEEKAVGADFYTRAFNKYDENSSLGVLLKAIKQKKKRKSELRESLYPYSGMTRLEIHDGIDTESRLKNRKKELDKLRLLSENIKKRQTQLKESK